MESVKKWNKWANAHTYYPLDILRIALGVFLILKGASFITNTSYLDNILSDVSYFPGGMITFHYVAAAHIVGGIMIAFGLLTRWAVIAQLPILLGAIMLNFIGDFSLRNLATAVIVLVICIFFLVYGSGKHSADYFFKMQQ